MKLFTTTAWEAEKCETWTCGFIPQKKLLIQSKNRRRREKDTQSKPHQFAVKFAPFRFDCDEAVENSSHFSDVEAGRAFQFPIEHLPPPSRERAVCLSEHGSGKRVTVDDGGFTARVPVRTRTQRIRIAILRRSSITPGRTALHRMFTNLETPRAVVSHRRACGVRPVVMDARL